MTFQRCATCGRSLESDDRVVRIARGVWSDHSFSEQEEFGFLHSDCFERSVESPVTAMQEIKKLAKASTRVLAPPKPKRGPKRIMVKPAEPKVVAVEDPPRRKRGRPPKNPAATATNASSTPVAKPRRGRRVRGGDSSV